VEDERNYETVCTIFFFNSISIKINRFFKKLTNFFCTKKTIQKKYEKKGDKKVFFCVTLCY
jgi:hypothetical protein